ncbi:hypothetical protein MFMK1_003459 [Metallumcola ferriviriculae]|uniref:Uncharacterized protein n=1 Tax=Metallumcola ferriviriculae TaxID=3039180 RepID=A0AAU0UTA0_9FIRM|nr:hypothetical protein MFMK1_003459 [Desulfitibacteraceae bacterium MK1]
MMGWLFILLGGVIIAFSIPEIVKDHQTNQNTDVVELQDKFQLALQEKESLEYRLRQDSDYDEIHNSLALLTHNLNLMQQRFDQFDETIKKLANSKELSFEQVMNDMNQLTLFDDIYIDYDQGKSITEIAREYKRGKGEIELILSLRK